MTLLAFTMGAIFHSIAVTILYSPFKSSPKYYWVALGIGLITNSIWLYITKNSENSSLYVRSLLWDSIIVGAYTLIPPLMFGIKLSPTVIIGCIFIVAGIVLTKIN